MSVLTIGNFDGVHRGHSAIIRAVVERSKREKTTSIVYTFNPHPRAVLQPEKKLQFLLSPSEKMEFIKKTGVDQIIEEPFTLQFSKMAADTFFREIVLKKIGARALYVGHDFGFGKGRSGTHEILKELCHAERIDLRIASPLKIKNEVCSSSKIRELLKEGNVEKAEEFLGYRYFYRGKVVRGHGRAKQIGVPTANVEPTKEVFLKEGVYATVVTHDGKTFHSVTNVGRRPTFEKAGSPLSFETHVFDQNLELYGKEIEVQLFARLRDEIKFSNVDALKAQIQKDIRDAKYKLLGGEL